VGEGVEEPLAPGVTVAPAGVALEEPLPLSDGREEGGPLTDAWEADGGGEGEELTDTRPEAVKAGDDVVPGEPLRNAEALSQTLKAADFDTVTLELPVKEGVAAAEAEGWDAEPLIVVVGLGEGTALEEPLTQAEALPHKLTATDADTISLALSVGEGVVAIEEEWCRDMEALVVDEKEGGGVPLFVSIEDLEDAADGVGRGDTEPEAVADAEETEAELAPLADAPQEALPKGDNDATSDALCVAEDKPLEEPEIATVKLMDELDVGDGEGGGLAESAWLLDAYEVTVGSGESLGSVLALPAPVPDEPGECVPLLVGASVGRALSVSLPEGQARALGESGGVALALPAMGDGEDDGEDSPVADTVCVAEVRSDEDALSVAQCVALMLTLPLSLVLRQPLELKEGDNEALLVTVRDPHEDGIAECETEAHSVAEKLSVAQCVALMLALPLTVAL